MKKNIKIREFASTDKECILNLLRLNTPKYFSHVEENDLIYYLDNEIEKYYVIEFEGKVIGSGGINFKENSSIGYISWDLLHPDYQGKGFGTMILKYRIDKLKENRNVSQIVVRTSQLVYEFYEKLGFVLIEQVKDYWAKGFDLYKMEYIDIKEN